MPAPKSGDPLFDPLAAKKTPSRTVTATRGSDLEVPFGALGWMFLGESSDKPGIVYDSRRFDAGSLVFIFKAELEGSYLLEFMKQDLLKDSPAREYVAVTVVSADATSSPAEGAAGTAATPAAAPSFASSLTPGTAGSSAAKPAGAAATPTTTPATPATTPATAATPTSAPAAATPSASSPAAPPTAPVAVTARPPEGSPEAVLIQAKADMAAGKPESAASVLLGFVDAWPDLSDEAYILLARLYEKSPTLLNIKKAYDYYKKVVDSFPASLFWDEAEGRKKYIERYYLRIK